MGAHVKEFYWCEKMKVGKELAFDCGGPDLFVMPGSFKIDAPGVSNGSAFYRKSNRLENFS